MKLLKQQGQGFEKLSNNAFDKSSLLRKVDFLLKSDFQVIAFFYSFGDRIPCYNCFKLCLQMSTTILLGILQNNFWNVLVV